MKRFSLLQLFSIVDGRLSTNIDDVYAILNHLTGEALGMVQLLAAKDFLEKVNPGWFKELRIKFAELGITKDKPLDECIKIITGINKIKIIFNI